MEKHILSKSTFIKGYHCLKSLYLHKKRPFLRDRLTAEQLAKFKRGHRVGDLAQQLFPGGIDVSPKSPSQYQKSAIRTAELMASGQEVIYEATFQYNQVLIMLDILVKTDTGWEAYEVKSSKHLSETYMTDAALQYYVMTQTGLELSRFYLVYVDEHYHLENRLNLDEYFIKKDVTSELIEKQDFIAQKIAEEMAMLQEDHSPKMAVGEHCFSPYKCDFVGFCWKKMKDKPYLPQAINLKGVFPQSDKDTEVLSFIFSEQAIPECENEKSYFQKCIGFKVGEGRALISGKNCKEKRDFIQSFFEQIDLTKRYLTFDKYLMSAWLGDVVLQFPEFEAKLEYLNQHTLGLIDTILEKELIALKTKPLYTLAFLAKAHLGDDSLKKSALSSDILATALFEKMETTLWADASPDMESLKHFLDMKQSLSKELYHL